MATVETAQDKPMDPLGLVVRSPLIAWDFLRRWPVIPGFVIVMFGLATIFTTQFATDDPNKQNLRGSFAPPFWYDEYYENNEYLDDRY